MVHYFEFTSMKPVYLIGCLSMLLWASSMVAYAQDLSKEEEKEWKKKQNDMDPLEFKAIFEEYGKLQGAASKHQRATRELRKEIETKSKQLATQTEELDTLNAQFSRLKETCGDMDVSPLGDDYSKGVVFKVQIGAYEKIDLSEFSDVIGSFGIEDEAGVKKYTVAYFREYQQAHIFKKYMRAMGITDAWVVVYEDDVRKNINEFIPKEQSLEEE